MVATAPPIDADLVRRLVATQFPHWAHLPVRPIVPGGWDNRTFRLGNELSVRLPSAEGYVRQVDKEQRWLPELAPRLPLPIPAPIALGRPDADFPWPWSIYAWIDGEPFTTVALRNRERFASDLATFLIALREIDATNGPGPGPHNFFRGGSPAYYDAETRRAIVDLGSSIDGRAATEVWEAALRSEWHRAPVWFHGDISSGNLLVRNGELSAVIDFGTSGVGDPACDLVIAFSTLADCRETFRSAVELDDATWARARGWAIWKALIVAAGSAGSHDPEGEAIRARRVIDEVLLDYRAAVEAG